MKRYSINELVSLCKRLKGTSHRDSIRIANEEGISKSNINVLRGLLGYTRPRSQFYSDKFKNEITSMVKSGKTAKEVAIAKGLEVSTVYNWCKKAGVEYNTRGFWTPNKIRTLCLYIMKGERISLDDDKECAEKIGATVNMVQCMRHRLTRKYNCKRWIPIATKMGIYEGR